MQDEYVDFDLQDDDEKKNNEAQSNNLKSTGYVLQL